MSYWLITWKTWLDEEIDTPWDFQLIQHTSEFRKRGTTESISDDVVNSLYLSGDIESVIEFENNHISAVVLATVIQESDPIHVLTAIKNVFYDAEILNFVEVPNELVEQVTHQLKKDQRPVKGADA